MNTKREAWVDYIKLLACFLVLLGHLFQSLEKAAIIPRTACYIWFDNTIYFFHIPLFFICSGYLYQRYSIVDSWHTWKQSITKKTINLGIPFFSFSFLTWLLKTVFVEVTSNKIGGLFEVLFFHPYPPYWYLYVLFFVFAVTPTVKTRKGALTLFAIAIMMKLLILSLPKLPVWKPYIVSSLFTYEFWFVSGMCLAVIGAEKIKNRMLGAILVILFIGLSVSAYKMSNSFVAFGMAIIACLSVFMMMVLAPENKLLENAAQYTMPIFLMHTLIAAPIRIALIQMRIMNPAIHIVFGLAVSIAGPIIAYLLLKRMKLDFLVFPGRILNRKNK